MEDALPGRVRYAGAAGPIGDKRRHAMGDWLSDHPNRCLIHFSDGGAGMREYPAPLKVGDEITDGGQTYRVVRVQERETRGGFAHAWAEPRTAGVEVR
jgi:hypothetical protein